MKKIFIILRDITEGGGGERVCVNLANAFSEIKHDKSAKPSDNNLKNKEDSKAYSVEIISFYRAFDKPKYRINRDVGVTYLSHKSTVAKSKILRFFNKTLLRFYLNHLALRHIQSHVRKDGLWSLDSITHIVLANDGTFVPPYKKMLGIKLLRLWHIKPPKKYKKVFNRFDKIIVLSKNSAKDFARLGGEILDPQDSIKNKNNEKVVVIPNFLPYFMPLDEVLKATENLKGEQTLGEDKEGRIKIILAAGRFTHEKGFFRLINMYSKIAHDFSQWRLHILGDGVLRYELEMHIKRLEMQDFIKLLPFSSDMQHEYLQSEIYAMSSFHEGFSMVILEASSLCVPCIAFDSLASAKELVQDGKSGFLVKSEGEYIQRLRELMLDSELRGKMGMSARKLVESRFSKKAILPLWEHIF